MASTEAQGDSPLASPVLVLFIVSMRYFHAATRPIIPDDEIREAMLAFVLALPALWALGEAAVALGL